ncbi:MAG: hypothetical protein MK086_06625 [Flavobacteriales bacterium]|nr:hypothetical protein [Flavobacteriales bacterium]
MISLSDGLFNSSHQCRMPNAHRSGIYWKAASVSEEDFYTIRLMDEVYLEYPRGELGDTKLIFCKKVCTSVDLWPVHRCTSWG